MKTFNQKQESGSVIVSILVVMLFLTTIIFGLIVLASSNLTRARNRIFLLQAQYAAESGADAAIAMLNAGTTTYSGTGGEIQILNNNQYRSTYTTTVVAGADDKEKIITATGKVYAPKTASVATQSRTIEVVSQRTSSTTATSIMSRNIIETGTSVKDIKVKDIYVNGFINLTKNTNNLIAENIIVADKNTGAANCSIGGTGTLTKPTSFTTPGQTKTKITMAYNNCVNPPGNNSNTNFDVLPNQTNINKIQSTNIPWAQYMNSSYQSSPGGCSDWTSGASPRDIPSTGNTKKTHYPNSDSNVSTSCGTSGDLNLGTARYNIRDHTHIRASLCAASACSPTFYNPDAGAAGIKFVFVEGSVNFSAVTTASGSGPIVFVVYGADPASKADVCPYGGAFYLGSGDTSAPALYIVASNGVCIDKSKFNVDPAYGGFSGKNIYVATNSGTPHDLHLDPLFPVDQIPVDLAWRAVRYRRL